jgi:hypothetical protein
VATLSGRQAHISVSSAFNVVTAVDTANGSPTNGYHANVNYITHSVLFGPEVDLIPRYESSKWRLTVLAAINEFLGYDNPEAGDGLTVTSVKGAEPIHAVKPLPHFFTAELASTESLRKGETLVLRGPRYAAHEPVGKDHPGRFSAAAKKKSSMVRLFVFVSVKDDYTVKP